MLLCFLTRFGQVEEAARAHVNTDMLAGIAEPDIQQTECLFEGEADLNHRDELLSRLKSLSRFQEDLTYKEYVMHDERCCEPRADCGC